MSPATETGQLVQACHTLSRKTCIAQDHNAVWRSAGRSSCSHPQHEARGSTVMCGLF
jgi:hypothetical protein